MSEVIDESISVDLFSNHLNGQAYPRVIHRRGIRYQITKLGFHHMVRDGRTLLHVFAVTDGTTFFNLQFNTDTLGWKLLEVDYDHNGT